MPKENKPASDAAAAPTEGYDEVGIPNGEGSFKRMPRQQFEQLPLGERVRLLMGGSGKLQFFRGGQVVNAREALRG
jgi:hypothetical protein